MKQYDSIYVPRREMNASEYLEVEGCGLEEIEGPAIVLSLEEAQDIFNAGMSRAKDIGLMIIQQQEGNPSSPDCKTFLKSKGIKTDNNG